MSIVLKQPKSTTAYGDFLRVFKTTQVYPYLARWIAEKPDLLFAPINTTPLAFYRGNAIPIRTTNGAVLSAGGLANPAEDISTGRMFAIPTTCGIGANGTFIAVCLVSHTGASTKGHLLKIGWTGGVGVAHGGSSDGTNGTAILMLREGIAWAGTSGAFTWSGTSTVGLGYTNQGVLYATQTLNAVEINGVAAYNAPQDFIYINGRNEAVGSPFTVHAAAVWNKSLSNIETGAFRAYLAADSNKLNGVLGVRHMFSPKRTRLVLPMAAASGAPSITALSAIGITATSAQPRISYS